MPVYPDIPTIDYSPSPELVVRPLYEQLGIRSILDVGAGHGGIFDKAFWDSQPMERREACDIYWMRDMGRGWSARVGVDACELSKHYGCKSFDMVQCLEVLEHIPDSRKALEELCAVARKLVLISSADELHHLGDEQERIEQFNRFQKYVKQPSIDALRDLGFEIRVDSRSRRQIVAWKVV